MEGLIIPLGIGILLLWLVTPFLVFNLIGRVRKLEHIVRGGTFPVGEAHEAPVFQAEPIPNAPAAPRMASGPTGTEKFIAWLKEDWLLKAGAIFLLIGFGWLTTYAFLNNWIGPMGRIALGITAGALILILGTWRIRKFVHQGGVFLVVGSTTILLTIFAAREIYDFFTPLTALVVMFLSSAYVALVSAKYNSKALSLASIALAGVAPMLTNSPSADYVSLFAYLLVVVLGSVWIVFVTRQREITAASLILVTLYSIPFLSGSSSSDLPTLLLFAYAFSGVFYITNTVGILKLKDMELIKSDLVTASGTGLFLLAWIFRAAPEEWKSLIIVGWMLVFVCGAFAAFILTKKREPFYVYAGIGVAMLAAATAAELQGAELTIAYTVESAMLVLVTFLLLKDIDISEKLSLLLIGPIFLSLQSMDSGSWGGDTILHEDFFVLLTVAVVLLGLGLFFQEIRKQKKTQSQAAAFHLVAGSFYVYLLIWRSLHTLLLNDDIAVMISLLIYIVIGLIAYFFGRVHGKKGLGLYGGTLLGFVIVRLLLVDVWRMELAGRIVTFFLMGILLMSTAFFRRKK